MYRSLFLALCVVASACGAAPPEPTQPAHVEAAPTEAPAEAPAPEPAAPEPEPEEPPPVVRSEIFGSPTLVEITLASRPRTPQLVGVLIWKIVMNRRGNGPEVFLQVRRVASGELELTTIPWTEYEHLPIARRQTWALPVAFQEGMRLRATPGTSWGGSKMLLLDVLAPGAAEDAEPLATFTLRLPERAQELVLSRGHPEGGYVPDSAVLPERSVE